MAVSVDHTTRRVTLTGTAPLTLADMDAGIDMRLTDGWRYAALIDFRAVADWLPTKDVVKSYAERLGAMDKTHGPRGPAAFVVTHAQPALYGMLRMYTIIADLNHGARIDVFYSMDEADAWLKVA
jgi:hypothetical protein